MTDRVSPNMRSGRSSERLRWRGTGPKSIEIADTTVDSARTAAAPASAAPGPSSASSPAAASEPSKPQALSPLATHRLPWLSCREVLTSDGNSTAVVGRRVSIAMNATTVAATTAGVGASAYAAAAAAAYAPAWMIRPTSLIAPARREFASIPASGAPMTGVASNASDASPVAVAPPFSWAYTSTATPEPHSASTTTMCTAINRLSRKPLICAAVPQRRSLTRRNYHDPVVAHPAVVPSGAENRR
jgi:hypothetical protein